MHLIFKGCRAFVLSLVFSLLFLLAGANRAAAFKLSEQAEISIITCDPGKGAADAYGHTAMRVKDPKYNYDLAFNYGSYDFSAPNFLYRFASGQTDYKLAVYPFADFEEGYRYYERSIYEQVLELTPAEKQKIVDFLIWNAKKENRVYRYNFFFDNCATRVRDVIVDHVEGGISFDQSAHRKETLRELVEGYHGKHLWLTFGIDLAVSAPSDREASLWEEMLLPDYLLSHFAGATKTADGIPMVKQAHFIYKAPQTTSNSAKVFGPFVILLLCAALVFVFSYKQFARGQMKYGLDFLVFGITGLMGVVLSWLALCSEHPAMNPNYNLLWAIPLNLPFAFALLVKKWRGGLRYYFVVVSVWLVLFVCYSAFITQKFHPAFYVLIGVVLIRSVLHSLLLLKARRASK